MSQEITDKELMKKVAQKDSHAFRILYRRYERQVFSLAKKIVGNKEEAEDVVQEVFSKLWNKPHLFDPEKSSKFSSWLLRVCHNAALDKIKSRKNNNVVQLDTGIASSTFFVENQIEQAELMKTMEDIVYNKLPKEQAEIIVLMYCHELTQREIAERTGIPLGTVKTRATTALKKIKALLQGGEENGHIKQGRKA
jgi:RNA polymerase sigma-70 factor (family 1)